MASLLCDNLSRFFTGFHLAASLASLHDWPREPAVLFRGGAVSFLVSSVFSISCSSSAAETPEADGPADAVAVSDATVSSEIAEETIDDDGSVQPEASDPAACIAGPDGSIGGPPPDDCPNDLPPDCPASFPHYDDVAPVIATHCTGCHRPGGIETSKLFGSYAQVYALRRDMLTQVYGCRMPPTCALQLTTDERHVLLQWFVCGAPGPLEATPDANP